MKKIRSIFCMLLLSACLVGNVFAGDSAGGGVLGFFDVVVNTVTSLFNITDPCEGRICTTCKPGSADGTCRPTNN
jgi:hypothetical protein